MGKEGEGARVLGHLERGRHVPGPMGMGTVVVETPWPRVCLGADGDVECESVDRTVQGHELVKREEALRGVLAAFHRWSAVVPPADVLWRVVSVRWTPLLPATYVPCFRPHAVALTCVRVLCPLATSLSWSSWWAA